MARNNYPYTLGGVFTALALVTSSTFAQLAQRPPVPGADAPGVGSLSAKPDKPASTAPVAATSASAAVAASAPQPAANHPIQQRNPDPQSVEYTNLQKEEALWEKRAKIAELKKKAAGWDQPVGGTANPNGPLPGAVSATTPPVVQVPAPTTAPVRKGSRLDSLALTGLSSFNGKRNAVVSVDGTPIDVSVGTPLVDGWVVAEISDSAVKLVNGKQHPHWLRK